MSKIEPVKGPPTFVVIISANIEWKVIRDIFKQGNAYTSPYGEWMDVKIDLQGELHTIIFFHGGWGKIAAAGSAQYVIDRWAPDLLINLGTCGGFEGQIAKGAVILVEKTIVYDIFEQMVDPADTLAHYTTDMDLSWLPEEYPQEVVKTLLVSGDRDLIPDEIPDLRAKFDAVAGDWESGAIAYVASRNRTKCLILRGVTDIVGSSSGEAYEDLNVYIQGTRDVLERLVKVLPEWLALFS
jgi:adenosylhomocysteine nucleosidase